MAGKRKKTEKKDRKEREEKERVREGLERGEERGKRVHRISESEMRRRKEHMANVSRLLG